MNFCKTFYFGETSFGKTSFGKTSFGELLHLAKLHLVKLHLAKHHLAWIGCPDPFPGFSMFSTGYANGIFGFNIANTQTNKHTNRQTHVDIYYIDICKWCPGSGVCSYILLQTSCYMDPVIFPSK